MMDSFLVPPTETFNLDELAKSTASALGLLVPWCQPNNLFDELVPISQQAASYVKAINSSIVASQQGFNIAEDAISFSEFLTSASLNPTNDSTTETQRQEYLKSMLDLAISGHKTAKDSMNKFRGVRQTVISLIEKAQSRCDGQGRPVDHSNLDSLKSKVSILETFFENISQYTAWWSRMEMSQNSLETKSELMVVKYNALRKQTVVKSWTELRNQYVLYTEKIRVIQDRYPQIFIEEQQERTTHTNLGDLARGPSSQGRTTGVVAKDAHISPLLDAPGPNNHIQIHIPHQPVPIDHQANRSEFSFIHYSEIMSTTNPPSRSLILTGQDHNHNQPANDSDPVPLHRRWSTETLRRGRTTANKHKGITGFLKTIFRGIYHHK
ncbi:hypothetical protein B0H34DRAFT_66462 [Crassisporium funariophilum]|nr:hypothetical protein B0H34DRAFT_66462 [Crassisporium funariophilum]